MQYLIGLVVLLVLASCGESREIRIDRKPYPDGRIVGGYAVRNLSDFPYQVSLQRYSSHYCGGSFINKRWVLTAAHCTEGAIAPLLKIRAGSLRRASGGVLISVESIHQNPEYNYSTIDYDFSLLKLSAWSPTAVTFGVARLPAQGADVADGTLLTVSGWGNTHNPSESSEVLRAVQVPKVNQKTCSDVYSLEGGEITNRMICAGFTAGGKDSCQGDSGGPLTINGTLVGVVSWGYGCGEPDYPGVYSRVASVRDWIKSVCGV